MKKLTHYKHIFSHYLFSATFSPYHVHIQTLVQKSSQVIYARNMQLWQLTQFRAQTLVLLLPLVWVTDFKFKLIHTLLILASGNQIARPNLYVLFPSYAFVTRDCKSKPGVLVIAVPHGKPFWHAMGSGAGRQRDDDCGLHPAWCNSKHCSHPVQKVAAFFFFFFCFSLAQESYHAPSCAPPETCHSASD